MATIYDLHTSISALPQQDLFELLRKIRAIRRTRPAAKKSAPAKTKRRPSRRKPKQQDLFALAEGMTESQKAALAASLLGAMKK